MTRRISFDALRLQRSTRFPLGKVELPGRSSVITIDALETRLHRLRLTAERLDRELRTVPRRARERGDALAREVQGQAETRLREARERAESLRDRVVAGVESTLETGPVATRVESLRKQVGDRIDAGVERAVAALPVASRQEVARLQRKLDRMQRKLRAMEKAQSA